jgi:hypothetical protein
MVTTPRNGWLPLAVALVGALACHDGDAATAPAADAVRVRLHYVGGRGGAALRVSARAGASTQSAAVGTSNQVTLRSGLSPDDSVEIRIDESGSATPRFHPAIATISGADLRTTQDFVLVPRRWTIAAGAGSTSPCRYSGQTVDIDLELAYARSVADPSSFYWRTPNAGGGWTYRTAAFPASALPVPVAFDRTIGTDPVTDTDSASFWSVVNELESEICTNAFQPVVVTAVSPPRGVRIIIDRGLDAVARGGPNIETERGASVIVGGSIVCRAASCLASGEVGRHELLHVLGFGHSCAWPTVMRAGCAGEPRASATDVAYFQVYYAVRAIQLSAGAQHALAAAHQGQRVIARGLPAEPVR